MQIRVLHNTTTDKQGRHLAQLDGYSPGNALTHVFTYDLPARDHEEVCAEAYETFNIGDDPAFGTPDPIALDYRSRRNRSLSKGDVIAIDGTSYAVDRHGFSAVTVTPEQITGDEDWGTTPYTGPLPQPAPAPTR